MVSVRHHRTICSIFHCFCFCVMIFSLQSFNSTTSAWTSKWKSAHQLLRKRLNEEHQNEWQFVAVVHDFMPKSFIILRFKPKNFWETHWFERYGFDDVVEALYVRLESEFHFEVHRRVVELENVKILVITNRKTIWKIEQTSKQCFQGCLEGGF